MGSNAWTHRRSRLPRPAVCKSYPKATKPQLPPFGVNGTFVWDLNPDGVNSTFSGVVPLMPTGGGIVYLGNGFDDQARGFGVTEDTDPLLTFDRMSFIMTFGGGMAWAWLIEFDKWPGTYPWTSQTKAIPGLVSPNVGQVFVTFNV